MKINHLLQEIYELPQKNYHFFQISPPDYFFAGVFGILIGLFKHAVCKKINPLITLGGAIKGELV